MASRSICSQVIVSQCFHCQGDTEYHCRTCGQNLCPSCKRSHTISLDTKDHNVTIYREKFNFLYKREMCITHPDQVYEMYCETCDLPFCVHCKEHEQHNIQNIRTAYENKRKQNYEIISNIRFNTLYALQVLFLGIQAAIASYKKEKILHLSNAMLKIPRMIKDSILNDICREITVKHKQLLMQKVCNQTMKAKKFILTIQTYENSCEQYVSRPVEFLRVFKKSIFPKIQDRPYLPQQFQLSLTQEISMEDLIKLLSDIQLTGRGKRRIGDEILLTLMPFPVLKKTFEVPDVGEVTHISCAESGQLWITGVKNIFLSDTTTGSTLCTVRLDEVSSFDNKYKGLHTVTRDYELIYIDRGIKIKKLSKDRKTTTTFIDNSNSVWKILCVYSSPFTGDLLVGMFRNDYGRKCRVGRYNSNGKLKQTIPHRNSTNKLYTFPEHVTENNNGDVVVSDSWRAVVVTSSVGRHRFSYTGPESGSKLYPEGICTDPLSHILVCDRETHTVQMIDKDGQFMFYLLTLDSPGIFGVPQSLSYDVNTHLLFVGLIENTSVYRYIDKSFALADTKKMRDDGAPVSGNYIYKFSQIEYDMYATLLTTATKTAEKVIKAAEPLNEGFKPIVALGNFIQMKLTMEAILCKKKNKREKAQTQADIASTHVANLNQFLANAEEAKEKAERAVQAVGLATTIAAAEAAVQEANEAHEILKKIADSSPVEFDIDYLHTLLYKEDEEEDEEEGEEDEADLNNPSNYTILYQR